MAREHPKNQDHKEQKRKKIIQTFCLVLLKEDMALLKLVTLRSDESSPSSVAAILAINSSGSGRHLVNILVDLSQVLREHLVFATWRQMSLRKASLSSWLSTISCTTYLERFRRSTFCENKARGLSYILSLRSSVSLQTIATRLLAAWDSQFKCGTLLHLLILPNLIIPTSPVSSHSSTSRTSTRRRTLDSWIIWTNFNA